MSNSYSRRDNTVYRGCARWPRESKFENAPHPANSRVPHHLDPPAGPVDRRREYILGGPVDSVLPTTCFIREHRSGRHFGLRRYEIQFATNVAGAKYAVTTSSTYRSRDNKDHVKAGLASENFGDEQETANSGGTASFRAAFKDDRCFVGSYTTCLHDGVLPTLPRLQLRPRHVPAVSLNLALTCRIHPW